LGSDAPSGEPYSRTRHADAWRSWPSEKLGEIPEKSNTKPVVGLPIVGLGTFERSDAVVERLPRPIYVLAVANFLVATGFGVMSPVLPVYARMFGVSSFLTGLVVSALAILRLVTAPVASKILKRAQVRDMVAAGTFLIAGTTFMMGVADTYGELLLWRGLSGFGSAMHSVGSLSLVFALAPVHMRGRANALTAGGWVVGGMAGPAIGGLVAQISIHAPFFFYSGMLLVSGLTVIFMIPRTNAQPHEDAEPAIPLRDLLHDRRFVTACFVSFAHSWQSFGVRVLLIPLWITEVLGLNSTYTGWAFAISAAFQFACLSPTGWASDKVGRRLTLVCGTAITAITSSVFAFSHSFVMLVALLCVYAVGANANSASSQALLADTVPANSGTALAAFQMAGDAGLVTGPLVAGALVDVLPMSYAWGVGALMLALASGLSFRLKPTQG
jgi:MFS family permease